MYSADIYTQKDEKPVRITGQCLTDMLRQADKAGAYAITEYLDGGKASMIRLCGDWIAL